MFCKLPSYLSMEFKFAQVCAEIAENGIQFDVELANRCIRQLTQEIEEIDKVLKPKFPNKIKQIKPIQMFNVKTGQLTHYAKKWIDSGKPYQQNIDGTMDRWEVEEGNLNSSSQLRDYLLKLGWKPSQDFDAWNYLKQKNKYGKLEIVKNEKGQPTRTTPKLPKSDLELDELSKISPDFKLVSDRLLRCHRLHSIEGYLKSLRWNNRIPMIINSVGAATMRVTHGIVANIPKAEERVYYGKELRSLFTCPQNRVLVGCDVSGMEACMLAHYLGAQSFIDFIINENFKYHKFFHQFVGSYTGSISGTKNLGFAFVFGAGDNKLGSLCVNKQGDKKELGAQVRAILMNNVPNLKNLQEDLLEQFQEYGGIIGLDGRVIPARKSFALINLVCQSAGAIFAKAWTCRVDQILKVKFPTAKLVIFYHDEIAVECDEIDSGPISKIMIDSIKWAGEYFRLKIPMTGEAKVGRNWAEVH